jgi:hypothetical protein
MCGPGTISNCFWAVRKGFSSISPAWSTWIAPGRIGFMSTRETGCRSAPTTETGLVSTRHGSRVATGDDRANRSEQADALPPSWIFPAYASYELAGPASPQATAARITLRQDDRSQQQSRYDCPGSPPLGLPAAHSPAVDCLTGSPVNPLPAVFARLHRTLPHVPAVRHVSPATKTCRRGPQCGGFRTERYDGKGNLHFKHAA